MKSGILILWGCLGLLLPLPCATAEETQTGTPSRDPMRPPDFVLAGRQEQPESIGEWVVSAIILNRKDRPVAILNGQPVSEGDLLGDAIVVRIEASRVLLRQGARDIILPVLPPEAARGLTVKK